MSFVKSDSYSTGKDNLFIAPTSETYVELPVCCLHGTARHDTARFLTIQCNVILALLQFCDKNFYAVLSSPMKAESPSFDNSNI